MALRVLFVCLGNICRSPTAEGLFRAALMDSKLDQFVDVDSCGTAGYHIGAPPDPRSVQAAAVRGIDISSLKARRVEAQDFDLFDYVLAMDRQNLRDLRKIQPPESKATVGLFLDYADNPTVREVPDPYYGGAEGFERVLDLIEAASIGLIDDIRTRHGDRLSS